MELSEKAIKEIAENIDCGMACFVNKKTKEVKSLLITDDFDPDQEYLDFIQKDLDEIENNPDDFIEIGKMSSRESFGVMEDFARSVENKAMKDRLNFALEKNKPFRNFKYEIEYDEEIRQEWFKFKASRLQNWVKTLLSFH